MTPLIVLVSCPVPGRPDGSGRLAGSLRIRLTPDSLAGRIYQKAEVAETFNCSYELNPEFRGAMEAAGILVSGTGENGEVRLVELPGHSFFLAAAFQPHLGSREGHPHPLIVAFMEAAAARAAL